MVFHLLPGLPTKIYYGEFYFITMYILILYLTGELGHGLLGIDVSKIKDLDGNTSERCGIILKGYIYLWNKDDGYNNMGDWIEVAAKAAGK